ncbi:hypothetical protein GF377_08275, partial [candidate division GN15 bacterium]|nr:hypothetical protein [candidate division GN15 bacterium]
MVPVQGQYSPEKPEVIQEILAAQEHFEQMVADSGMKVGFLECMTDDGVTFFPDPRLTYNRFNMHPHIPGRLSWEAEYVEASGAGDLGLTYGPFSFYGNDEATSPNERGHLLTVYRRGP